MSVEARVCPHCYLMEGMGVSHTKTCNCTHHHADHNFCGGCRIAGCLCEGYSQAERTVRAPRVSKIRHEEPIEHVDIVELLAEAEKQEPSELVAAQTRLEALRNRKKRFEETCEKDEAESI